VGYRPSIWGNNRVNTIRTHLYYWIVCVSLWLERKTQSKEQHALCYYDTDRNR
jgi:hypothetical protein